ncbi:uncharacterized protein LOC133150443 isoform X1 [Syngnathus typhle]|uniref:uncharacterized protein LOC133150443 isoform X1 n=1 Tax=Syngnathus typhle TaxID=161592 RepID=UPI002A6AAC61|nr:uncharacterized protein LOC133150443 isoform X1 [Syngnathus typhle]
MNMDNDQKKNTTTKGFKSSQSGSSVSRKSSSSTKSSVSAAAAKARAKAEAARARAAFAEREISIKVNKARLEASLDALQLEREAAAANAQAEALEAAAEIEEEELRSKRSFPVVEQDTQERVSEYVRDQTTRFDKLPEPVVFSETAERSIEPHLNAPTPYVHKEEEYIMKDSWPAPPQLQQRPTSLQSSQPIHESKSSVQPHTQENFQVKREKDTYNTNPTSKLTFPKYSDTSHMYRTSPESSVMLDMAKYLARKELVCTGLSNFDDRPESYRAWKSSFFNTIKDLDLTASEQLDLLSKWLGKESSEHVRRLRAVNIGNPNAALRTAWERLDECFGAPEVIENALFAKLDNFPRISNKDSQKLRELGDLLKELLSAKEDGYLSGLAFLDTARGIKPIVEKLPFSLQERWLSQGSMYKQDHKVSYPPFSYFTSFICYQAKTRNDPSFTLSGNNLTFERAMPKHKAPRTVVSVHKTKVSTDVKQDETASEEDVSKQCPIHKRPHPLKKCRGFRLKTLADRKAYLKEQGICFKCCSSSSHPARDCKAHLKCDECDSENHITALHPGPPPWAARVSNSPKNDGGESELEETTRTPVVSSLCTKVCGDHLKAKSCSKICLVKVYPDNQPEKAEKMYAMLDDQSNRSLARSQFFDIFKIETDAYPYTLKTCAGLATVSGRKATGYHIEAVNGGVNLTLPELTECDDLPDNRDEIPTPEAALHHPHLKSIANEIPALDDNAQILLLLGRDILRIHKVRQQINGPGDTPFAQRLDLGWVLVGDVCLGKVHKPIIHSYKTNVLEDGRPSLFRPCTSHINLKQATSPSFVNGLSHSSPDDSLGLTVFARTDNDDKRAFSIEDEQFIKIMNDQVFQDECNSWVAPLPFKTPRPPLSNNREQAMTRLSSLKRTLERKPKMKEQFVTFMQKIFDNNHAEPAPPLQKGRECWYLPMFGVYHPRKPGQIRVVFDSSAQSNGLPLNNVLLTGPDLNNSLIGVLIRFRREKIAVMADIEQMFHCFVVREDHRDYLRFLWFRENDPAKTLSNTG